MELHEMVAPNFLQFGRSKFSSINIPKFKKIEKVNIKYKNYASKNKKNTPTNEN